jgi:hypothetical protein
MTDRETIQSLLDANAGGIVTLPNGTYTLERAGTTFGCLFPPTGVTLRGESRDGVVLLMAPGTADSIQLIRPAGADVRIENLTLDGNRANQAASLNMQRHGVFCKQAPRCSVVGVTARAFTGDGFYFYDGSDDPLVSDCLAIDNQRNGLTLGGGTTGGVFRNSQFLGNGAEQFDSEGGVPINNVTITGCTMDALGASNDFVLTMTGHTADTRSSGWTVTGNVVNGPVLAVYITDVLYARNAGINPTTKPSVFIYRSCDRIRIEDNQIHATGPNASSEGAMVHVLGTSSLQMPGGVRVSGNKLTTVQPQYGVSAIAVRDIEISDNAITGAGGSKSGVYVRTILEPVEAIIERNTISDFAGGYSVRLGGNGAAQIKRIEINGNTFKGAACALYLNSGYNEARDVTQSCNVAVDGLTMVTHPPAGAAVPWGDGTRWVMT